jgi:cell division protease FtsH
MVKAYGMSKTLGPLSYDRGRPLFLEAPWSQPKDYSEETAKKIDEEVKTILTESYEKAKSILTERIEKLKSIASILLDKEVIEGDELKELLKT